MAKVLVPLAPGFEDIEAVTIIDVLRRGKVEVITASLDLEKLVRSAHGIFMEADGCLADFANESFDAVVLPGGGEGTENLKRSAAVKDLLIQQAQAGRLVAAICAAPTVLEAFGVVPPEIHMTCYPTCQMELNRPWVSAPVVRDANFITGQAPGSSMLFALVLLQTLVGETTAQKVARGMVTDVLE